MTMTIEQISKATGTELSNNFNVSFNAGHAAASYLMVLAWGKTIEEATEAASDFIECEADVDGLEAILLHVKQSFHKN